jgi:hypothetical protein
MPREALTHAGTPPPSERRVASVRFIPHWLRKAYRSVKQAYENRKQEKAARRQLKNDHTDSQTKNALPDTPAVQDHAPFIPPLKFEATTIEGLSTPLNTPADPDTIPRTRFLKYRERPTSKGRQSGASQSPQKAI